MFLDTDEAMGLEALTLAASEEVEKVQARVIVVAAGLAALLHLKVRTGTATNRAPSNNAWLSIILHP